MPLYTWPPVHSAHCLLLSPVKPLFWKCSHPGWLETPSGAPSEGIVNGWPVCSRHTGLAVWPPDLIPWLEAIKALGRARPVALLQIWLESHTRHGWGAVGTSEQCVWVIQREAAPPRRCTCRETFPRRRFPAMPSIYRPEGQERPRHPQRERAVSGRAVSSRKELLPAPFSCLLCQHDVSNLVSGVRCSGINVSRRSGRLTCKGTCLGTEGTLNTAGQHMCSVCL